MSDETKAASSTASASTPADVSSSSSVVSSAESSAVFSSVDRGVDADSGALSSAVSVLDDHVVAFAQQQHDQYWSVVGFSAVIVGLLLCVALGRVFAGWFRRL